MKAAQKNQQQQQQQQQSQQRQQQRQQQSQQRQQQQQSQQLDTQQQQQPQNEEPTVSSSEQDVPENRHSSQTVPQRTRGRPRKTDLADVVGLAGAGASASVAPSSKTEDSIETPSGADSAADINLTAQDLSSGSAHGAAPAELPSNSVDVPVKRSRGRPRKNPASVQVVPASTQQPSGEREPSSKSPGELRDVPAGILKQRRDANPRETPIAGDDVAFD